MILKGNQRGGGRQMALHLLNVEQNEHVEVHEVSGFIAEDVQGALKETYAMSKATKCTQYMYSLSLNPPEEAGYVTKEKFIATINRAEKKLGLEGQPRLVVFHDKEGRGHAHCVWSRIDSEKMIAVNMSHDHNKLFDLSKKLFIENDWTLPPGFIDKNKKSPLNYTRQEWAQAQRTKQNPQEIREALQESWAISDSRKAFEAALKERGYFLAQGNKGRYIAVDLNGKPHSLTRKLNKEASDLKPRLGDPAKLLTVDQRKEEIGKTLGKIFKSYSEELSQKHRQEMSPLLKKKQAMTKQHRAEREAQQTVQQERWASEEAKRIARIRRGFKGLWDRLTGSHARTQKKNEAETQKCLSRDRKEQDNLRASQLETRQGLQNQVKQLRTQQKQERADLVKDVNRQFEKLEMNVQHRKWLEQERKNRSHAQKLDKGPDFEPGI